MFSSFVKTYSKQTFWGKDFIPAAMDISSKAVTLLARFLTKNVCFIKKILQFHIKMSETQQPTRVLAHSYYPLSKLSGGQNCGMDRSNKEVNVLQ